MMHYFTNMHVTYCDREWEDPVTGKSVLWVTNNPEKVDCPECLVHMKIQEEKQEVIHEEDASGGHPGLRDAGRVWG